MLDLSGGLLGRDVGVRVVHLQTAHPGEAVDDPRLFIPIDRPEFEQPQRQLAVGTSPRAVDEVVHRTVHRFEVVIRPLHAHGREHRVGVVGQVPGGVEEPLLGDVRRADVEEALLDVPPSRVVLHFPLEDPALGVEHRKPAAELVREGVEVKLDPEFAVIAPFRLGQPVEVCREVGLRRPGRSVDPLQLLVGLVAAPVGRAGAGDLEGVAEQLGRRDVRAPAEVTPGPGAIAAHVVVDRQLGAADLDPGTFRRVLGRPALEPDELALERLAGQLDQGVLVAHLAAHEGLALVDDPLHDLFELFEVFGRERRGHVEVVVEPVPDRRADAEFGVGVDLLDGLREHVGARVAQHLQPVGVVDAHRLDGVAVGEDMGQVAKLTVDPGNDDRSVIGEQVGGGSRLRDRSLVSGDGHGDAGRHCGLPAVSGAGRPRAAYPRLSGLRVHGRAGFGALSPGGVGRAARRAPPRSLAATAPRRLRGSPAIPGARPSARGRGPRVRWR
ncbi:MAG: hypothetical protein BWY91_02046 [bacterium ADurb.BinA028]|nr:MAG: hypothetical protein BWY91_02046 [bacterium ADurb.BinA028]